MFNKITSVAIAPECTGFPQLTDLTGWRLEPTHIKTTDHNLTLAQIHEICSTIGLTVRHSKHHRVWKWTISDQETGWSGKLFLYRQGEDQLVIEFQLRQGDRHSFFQDWRAFEQLTTCGRSESLVKKVLANKHQPRCPPCPKC
jgi:hypothetical protein